MRVVAHTLPQYLPRASTFIYSAIRFQTRAEAVVIARSLANEGEFPLRGKVYSLGDDGRPQRLVAAVHGYRERYGLLIERTARREGCALFHAHHGWSGPVTVRPARRLGLPLITTFYGRDLALQKSRKSFRQPYDALFASGAAFVCEGPAMARHLIGRGCPEHKIAILKIGVDLAKFAFRIPVRSRPFIVVQAARFVEKKGIDLALRAFATALPKLGSSELWLIGDGELRVNLELLAAELGIVQHVRFLGECSHREYRDVIGRAHACIQPSRTAADGDTEGGAPTVLLEMQARGIPIVGTRHADIPFVVADPKTLVDEEDVAGLADALVELASLSDQEYRERVLAGRAHVEAEHDVIHTTSQLEQLYDQVLAEKPIGRATEVDLQHA